MQSTLPQVSLKDSDAREAASQMFDELGFFVLNEAYTPGEVNLMRAMLLDLEAAATTDQEEFLFTEEGHVWAIWNLYDLMPVLMRFVLKPEIFTFVPHLLGEPAEFCRATLMQKAPGTRHRITWHQDSAIAVDRESGDENDKGVRAGVPHWEPCAEVMSRMVAARVSVDGQYADGGAVAVVPGSHNWGMPTKQELLDRMGDDPGVIAPVPEGGVLFYNQLMVHCSGPSTRNDPHNQRKVIHHEFRAESCQAGDGIDWWRWAQSCRVDIDGLLLRPRRA